MPIYFSCKTIIIVSSDIYRDCELVSTSVAYPEKTTTAIQNLILWNASLTSNVSSSSFILYYKPLQTPAFVLITELDLATKKPASYIFRQVQESADGADIKHIYVLYDIWQRSQND